MNDLNVQLGMVWQGDSLAGWVEANRRIYDYELVYFSRGRCRTLTGNGMLLCAENSVLILPPDCEYVCAAETKVTRWCVHFDWFGTCPAYRDGRNVAAVVDKKHVFDPAFAAGRYERDGMTFPAVFRLSDEEGERIKRLFRAFFAVSPDTAGRRLERLGIFLQILSLVMDSRSGGVPEKRERNTVFFCGKRLIDERFDDPGLEMRAVARELLITPNHLNKIFRRNLGLSPSTYLQNLRLDHAASLLAGGRMSVGEVADRCGFSSANYFIRCFRMKNGITPLRFRERAREARGITEEG
ncbi:MAG: helix-turn-helix transcriptional regulator [Lentisphaeria bacterium]|nr:helix-turn-helix transcriptional regulator [Lentisphaeria bacterium]